MTEYFICTVKRIKLKNRAYMKIYLMPLLLSAFYHFFVIVFLLNSADLCSLGAPTTIGRLLSFCFLTRCLIITVVHQQRQHYVIAK